MINVSIFAADMDEKYIEIIENTWKLYTKYGIKSITMDDIATKNSISKKT